MCNLFFALLEANPHGKDVSTTHCAVKAPIDPYAHCARHDAVSEHLGYGARYSVGHRGVVGAAQPFCLPIGPHTTVLYWYQLTTPAFWAGNIVLFWPWAALLGLSVLELVRLGIRTFRSHRVAANIQQHPDTVVLAQILRINGRIAMTYSQPNDALPVPQVIANLSDADRVLWKDLTAQRCHHSGASGHQFTGYDDQGIRRFLAARTTLRVYEFINTTNTIPYLWSTSDGDDVAVYYQPQSGPAHLIMARITPKGSIQHSSLRLWLLLTFAEIRSIGEDS